MTKISKIKLKRNELGLTQLQVALKSGVSYRSYQAIEAGKRLPNVLSAIEIASALNTTVEELFPAYEDAKIVAGDSSSSQNNCIKKKPLPQ